jgi:hypothetical protein
VRPPPIYSGRARHDHPLFLCSIKSGHTSLDFILFFKNNNNKLAPTIIKVKHMLKYSYKKVKKVI